MTTVTYLNWGHLRSQVGHARDFGAGFVARLRAYRAKPAAAPAIAPASHQASPSPPGGEDVDHHEPSRGTDARNLKAVYGLRHRVAHTR
jgi:hypothetical protein